MQCHVKASLCQPDRCQAEVQEGAGGWGHWGDCQVRQQGRQQTGTATGTITGTTTGTTRVMTTGTITGTFTSAANFGNCGV